MRPLWNSLLPSVLILPLLGGAAACGAVQQRQAPAPASDLLPREAAALRAAGIDRARLACTSQQMWNPALRKEAKASATQLLGHVRDAGVALTAAQHDALHKQFTDVVAWRMVLSTLIDGQLHNLGAVRLGGLRGPDGKPLLLFRSGFTAAPERDDSCVASLVRDGGVRHVVNLYAGAMPTEQLAAAECARVRAAGGTCWDARVAGGTKANWREDLRDGETDTARREAMQAVAALIREELLTPQGKPPSGNALLHCGGGMHRTGMVVGIIERCLNGASMAEVEDGYKRHVAFRSAADPGGYELENLHFIEKFDCSLLQ